MLEQRMMDTFVYMMDRRPVEDSINAIYNLGIADGRTQAETERYHQLIAERKEREVRVNRIFQFDLIRAFKNVLKTNRNMTGRAD